MPVTPYVDNGPPKKFARGGFVGGMASATGGVTGENKKGEVNELKASLRNPAIDRDPEKKREVIKRVIAYMTLGIDVSKLFSEMIMVRCALPAVYRECTSLLCSALTADRNPSPNLTTALLCSLRQAVATKDHVVKKMVYLYRGGWKGAVLLVPQLYWPGLAGQALQALGRAGRA